ncbi:MAG: exosortase E/protease, VPEID-CTERM system [Deltaproteobacteria bacterium]|nr:exosortase E/protease, VPEID-CTERM system [Deltaproteobacteria bacterium]
MLLAEYLLVSVSFSADSLRLRGGWWSALGVLDPFGAVLLAAVTAAFLTDGKNFRRGSSPTSPAFQTQHAVGVPLLVNAACFSVFSAVTRYVFGPTFSGAASPGLWLVAWAALGAAVLLSATAIALPLRSVTAVLRRSRRSLAVGSAVGLAAWAAGRAGSQLGKGLGRMTLEGAAGLLRLTGRTPVVDRDRLLLGIDDYVVHIATACGGYEGVGLIVIFLGTFLWLDRRRLRYPHAWLLLPLGVSAVLTANVVRIAALIALGRWVSPAIAEGGFHSKAGWVMYCAIALGIVALSRRSTFLARAEAAPVEETWNPTAVYLGPLLALIATAMTTGLFTAGFDYFYPLRFVVVAVVLWAYRGDLPRRGYRPSWEAVAIGVAVFILWLGLEPPPNFEHVSAWKEHLDGMSAAARCGWLVFRILGSVLTVSIAEELAFRGFLLRRLVAADFTAISPRTFTWSSLLLSSLAFGALHQRWVAGTLAGIGYALAQRRHGRVGDAIVAHAVTNALIAADVLLLGAWWLWL